MTVISVYQILILITAILAINSFALIYNELYILLIISLLLTYVLLLIAILKAGYQASKLNYLYLVLILWCCHTYIQSPKSLFRNNNIYNLYFTKKISSTVSVIATINQIDTTNNKYGKYYYASIQKVNDSISTTGNIVIVSKDKSLYKLGDTLFARGYLIDNLKSLAQFELSKQLNLNSKEVFLKLIAKNIKLYKQCPQWLNFVNSFFDITKKLNIQIQKNNFLTMPPKESSTYSAIVLGSVATQIDKCIITDFRQVGLSQLLAASGFNLGIIILATNFILKIFRTNRILKYTTVIFITIIYSSMAGFSASIVRAYIMVIIYQTIKLFYRKADVLNVILFVLIINCINNPYCVLNTGFQLTYLATLGIIIATKFLSQIQKKSNFIIKYLKDNFIGILIVQLLILPIIIFNYQNINLALLLSNLICSTLVSIITIIGFASGILSIIQMLVMQNNSLNKIFLLLINSLNQLALPLVKMLLFIAHSFNQLEITKIAINAPSGLTIIFYYLIIFIILYFIRSPKIQKYFYIIYAFLVIVLLLDYNLENKIIIAISKKEIIVCHHKQCAVLSISNKISPNNNPKIAYNLYTFLNYYNLDLKNKFKRIEFIENKFKIKLDEKLFSTIEKINQNIKITIIENKQTKYLISSNKIKSDKNSDKQINKSNLILINLDPKQNYKVCFNQ